MSREISLSLPSTPTTLENFRSSNESLVDNFISDILSTVSIVAAAGPAHLFPQSSAASTSSHHLPGSSGSAPCDPPLPLCAACLPAARPARLACATCGGEPLCDACAHAHRRVLLTRDHAIEEAAPLRPGGAAGGGWREGRRTSSEGAAAARLNGDVGGERSEGSTSSGDGTSGGVSVASSLSPPTTICCNHAHPASRPSCSDCAGLASRLDGSSSSNDHDPRGDLMRVQRDVRGATTAVRQALDEVQRAAEKVDHRAFAVAAEVRKVMRRFVTAFEARELELLRRIEQGRQVKISLLQSQLENLRVCYTRLALASENITESMVSMDAQELARCSQMASRELRQARAMQSSLLPCEDDCFAFIPPPESCFGAINNMGKLRITSSASDPSFFTPPRESVAPATNRYRPIYGAPPVTVRDGGPKPTFIFGREGEGDGELCRPWGITCNRDGHFIVADRSNNRVQVFDSRGNFLFKFGTQGTGPGQFDRPAGVAVNPRDDIVVADKDNHRVQVFRRDGTYVLSFGEKGTQIGQFQYPWDVACDSSGNILVSDTRNHRVQLFNWNGIFVAKYGFEGPPMLWKSFDSPRGVSFTPRGDVVVSDFNNHRLALLDGSLTNAGAQYVGVEGAGRGHFVRPQGVVVDDRGNIVVADSRNNRIQIFNERGTFMWSVGLPGKNEGELDRPSGICLTPEGRVAVVDFGNSRVQVF